MHPVDGVSITSWHRIEPRARSDDPDRGLEARVHDPLWLLGRQWQFGEFEGEDRGSPVAIQAEVASTLLRRWLPRVPPAGASPGLPYDSQARALEVLVEREPPPARLGLRPRAHAGSRFLELLAAAGHSKYRPAYSAAFPLTLAADAAAADPGGERVARLFSGRVPDGQALAASLRPALHPATGSGALPATPPIDTADAQSVQAIATTWLSWYDAEVAPPSPGFAWVPERMEYQFTVSAPDPAGSGEIALSCPEYPGDGLDWYDFVVRDDVKLGAAGAPTRVSRSVLPAPVTFSGMPAERWWEFEDASVDLGSLDVAPDDLARLLLVEFATVFGNGWFLVPIDLPYGSLNTVLALVVTDTFGEHQLIRPTEQATGLGGPWRMFRLTGQSTARGAQGSVASLFLPPVLAQHVPGAPLEDVLLLRDEAADMAWAVERIVQGPTGDPRNRDDEWQRQVAAAASQTLPSQPLAPLVYHLATSVPEHWIPLVPVHDGERAVRLQRGAMLRFGVGSPQRIEPLGRVLEPGTVLRLFEEEVPRAGSHVSRVPLLARWLGGEYLSWTARRKGVGRGEGSSNLRYDVAEPVP